MFKFLKLILTFPFFLFGAGLLNRCFSSMTWDITSSDFSYKCKLEFSLSEGKKRICITCNKKLLNSLESKTQSYFCGTQYVYEEDDEVKAPDTKRPEKEIESTPLQKRLVIDYPSPQMMSVKQLSDVVLNDRVIFYTGAGISAPVVPAMDQLESKLGLISEIHLPKNLKRYVETIVENPQKFLDVMTAFRNDCIHGAPTDAHQILAHIIQEKKLILLTENVDQLHQKTGVKVIFREDYRNNSDVEKEILQNPYIVTIGLHSDESGFLFYAKRKNSNIRIISVNQQKVNYLSSNDYWVKGDIQTIFKEIQNMKNQKS